MPAQRMVVKLGTSTLTGGTKKLNPQRMLEIVQQVARLHAQNVQVVVVSSGAQAAGRERLNFPDLGRIMSAKQMLAAVGQGRLMHLYSQLFDIFDIAVGQVLLTREDLADRARYLNARDTLEALLESGIIPIINENDTTATHEIRVGDNDNLSALVANVLEADLLVLLTDIAGLYNADPRNNPAALLIPEVAQVEESILALAGGAGSSVGTGGMVTKLQAAQLATRGGVTTVIADGTEANVLARLLAGEAIGTRFLATNSPLESRQRWLLSDKPRGQLHIDAGAAKKLRTAGASLLPVGLKHVEGNFERGETVAVHDDAGRKIAHGIVSYSSSECARLCGVKSASINSLLGYSYGDALIHRNNMIVLG